MSAPQAGESGEASGIHTGKSQSRRTSRRNTISEGSVSQASENQAIISKINLPFLPNRGKGRLNVSEASIPAPQSSDISAQGQVFVSHEHPGGTVVEALHDRSERSNEAVESTPGASEPPAKLPRDEHSQPVDTPSDPGVAQETAPDDPKKASMPTTRPGVPLFTQSESAVEIIAEPFAGFGPSQARSVPAIRIHRPSGTVMAASVGTTAMNSAKVPATPMQSALEQSPAAAGTAPVNTLSTTVAAIPAPTNLPVDPSNVSNAIGAATSAVSLPSLPVSGKVGKRKRVIRKTRKLVLRRRLLAIIIGRDLANVVHPQLNPGANVAGSVPLPVDGPSDLVSSYTSRTERKRDFRRRQLDQRIAAARIHAEAEEIHRCRICRGLTRTMSLRRYHRLQLKRDRPDMNTFDRRATAMSRVAVFKCKCDRRLLGVANEVAVRDAAPTQHLRGPAAIEPPLSGVEAAQQR
ncbi:hypothetical protein G647_04970 [Cladophialophora carrionii CBS 160.54]|uniref:Uncharacterized protein n=1 Tax=Cladophialophora carrionii CBS 160.54 TaxID=1279043 RepID=V9DA46_9EURO|nr:uncharacterized protein G647_04970 [Cladophialophora carrionii CBS 160.54]ETI23173.1 hypothetical protein G647_04970 [Cladophialophora carrionii CBS 160.54]